MQVASCQVLRKKLLAEKKVRKASEQWLKAELKSRVRSYISTHINNLTILSWTAPLRHKSLQEDLEGLFASVREIAKTQQNPEDGADRMKRLVDRLRTQVKRDCGGRPSAM